MKLLVASMYFDSCKAEEIVSLIMIQSSDKLEYKTYVTQKPTMKPSYVRKLEIEWESKQEMEIDLQFYRQGCTSTLV